MKMKKLILGLLVLLVGLMVIASSPFTEQASDSSNMGELSTFTLDVPAVGKWDEGYYFFWFKSDSIDGADDSMSVGWQVKNRDTYWYPAFVDTSDSNYCSPGFTKFYMLDPDSGRWYRAVLFDPSNVTPLPLFINSDTLQIRATHTGVGATDSMEVRIDFRYEKLR